MCICASIVYILYLMQKVEQFTRNRAIVQNHKGGKYSIIGEQITGEFIELVRPSRIVLKWRQKHWPESKSSVASVLESRKIMFRYSQVNCVH